MVSGQSRCGALGFGPQSASLDTGRCELKGAVYQPWILAGEQSSLPTPHRGDGKRFVRADEELTAFLGT